MIRLSFCVLFLPVCWSIPMAGWVESPGYPQGYESYASLTWSRCAPLGHTLALRLLHLDLEDGYECENDVLKVYTDDSLIVTLCGRMSLQELQANVNPSLLSSSGGCLNISFSTDYSNSERHTGFRGFYTVQDYDECDDPNNECSHFCNNYIGGYMCSCPHGYQLNADNHTCNVSCTEDLSGSQRGQVTSPGSPGPYAADAQCSYRLAVEEGLQLVLEFTGKFDVETKSNEECADSVRILTRSKTFGPFCGQELPGPINTGSNQVQILFDSDETGTNTGFTVTYKVKRMTCQGHVTENSSVLPRHREYVMGETIIVTCDVGTVVGQPIGPGIKSNMTYESRCQKDGSWYPLYRCEMVECEEPTLSYALVVVGSLSTHYKSQINFTCNSQYYKLDNEEEFTCEADGLWKSRSGQTKFPRCHPVCGLTGQTIGRIWGGRKAKLGQIPWQLLTKSPRGGASLINDRWAVTAAHVVDGKGSFEFRGGMVDSREKTSVVMYTEKIILHPHYDRSDNPRTNYDNDIALLKMSSRVELGPNLRPICLPIKAGDASTEGEKGTVSGYGMNKKYNISIFLQHAEIEEYSRQSCSKTPTNDAGRNLIFTDNMFCAGMADTDSCEGDSGGPLFVPRIGLGTVNNPYTLKGIVSWGALCRGKNYKGYYTKVQNYLDWIKETIEKDDDN